MNLLAVEKLVDFQSPAWLLPISGAGVWCPCSLSLLGHGEGLPVMDFGLEQSWTAPEEATVAGKLRASANKQELAKSQGTTLPAMQQGDLGESVRTEHKEFPRLPPFQFQVQEPCVGIEQAVGDIES